MKRETSLIDGPVMLFIDEDAPLGEVLAALHRLERLVRESWEPADGHDKEG